MNIGDFQYHINPTILGRGYDYYTVGNVIAVYKQGDHEYIFHIEGSDVYEILVGIGDNGDILHSYCDCPYNFGPICKHEVAAYFKAFEILDGENEVEKVPTKTEKQETIHDVLSKLSKEELINIIANFALEDETIENSLLFTYANGDQRQELKACQELIYAIASKYTGREGFITSRHTGPFARELADIIDKARNMENEIVAIDIALLLLEEAIVAFSYADDSNGYIGSLVEETLEVVDEITSREDMKSNQRVEVFEKILSQTDHDIFEGWIDYKIHLLSICSNFAADGALREQLEAKIESLLDESSSDWSKKYANERLLQLLFGLIEQYGTKNEADQFIHENLQYSSFREELLNKYLDKENYEEVIEIAYDGEKHDQQYPGLLTKWKKYRYKALKYLSLKKEQQLLAKELFFNGDFEYYHDLKELADDQEKFYQDLKHELKSGKVWHMTNIFLQLIEEEDDVKAILEFVQENPRYIEDYAKSLVDNFEEDVIEIYEKHIKSSASRSTNRKAYQQVCYKLIGYKKIAGKQNQEQLINELKGLYSRRPAFIDELGKV